MVSKKKLDRGVGGWGELYPNVIWMFRTFLTLRHPLTASVRNIFFGFNYLHLSCRENMAVVNSTMSHHWPEIKICVILVGLGDVPLYISM